MIRKLVLFVVTASSVLPSIAANGDTSGAQLRAQCGVNCLYMFMHSRGADASFTSVQNALGVSPIGHTYRELRTAGRTLGQPCDVYRCEVADLNSFVLPLIAHWSKPSYEGYTGDDALGHYILVLSTTASSVTFADGTTGEISTVSRDWISRIWTGQILTDKPVASGYDTPLAFSLAFLVLSVPLVLVSTRLLSHRLRVSARSSRTVCFFLALLANAAYCERIRASELLDHSTWRGPENDAINSLYIYLRVHGSPATYDDLRTEFRKHDDRPSMLTLQRISQTFGVPSELRRLNWGDALVREMPFVTIVEPRGRDSGIYLLAHFIDQENVHVVDGAYATFAKYDRDTFMRIWSGISLVPIRSENTRVVIGAAVLLTAVCSGLWLRRK